MMLLANSNHLKELRTGSKKGQGLFCAHKRLSHDIRAHHLQLGREIYALLLPDPSKTE